MMKCKLLPVFVLLFITCSFWAEAQPSERRITREEYIQLYKEEAIKEMHASGVPASITLAQGMLESGYGNSPLARYANNHFGIKCHKGWTGGTFYQDDDEKNECFRKYYSVYESFHDHSEFLRTRSRYASLFELNPTDYKAWAHGLKKAGYATNPKYAHLLIRIIEENKLQEYDKIKKMKPLTVSQKVEKTPELTLARRETRVHDNNIKYIIAKKDDSFYKIANELNMGLWQLYKYNDLNKGDALHSGDIIYLQPKRRKAEREFHTVKNGESMRDISQKHGIRLKTLYRKNRMPMGTQPQTGQKLSLRKRVTK